MTGRRIICVNNALFMKTREDVLSRQMEQSGREKALFFMTVKNKTSASVLIMVFYHSYVP